MRVPVLVGLVRAGNLLGEPVRHGVVALRRLGLDRVGADDHLGAEGLQERDLLAAHLVGHREDAAVALERRDDREARPGVAGGRLHDRPAGLQLPLALGRLDHRDRDPVLDRAARVEVLELGEHRRRARGHDVLEPDERRVAHQLQQRRILASHRAKRNARNPLWNTAGVLGKACFRLGLIALVTLAAGTAAAVKSQARGSVAAQCEPSVDPAYAQEIGDALAQKQDVWGNELLASPAGPTADGVQGYLHPLMLVGRPGGAGPRHLTDSGVYYVPFGRPDGPDGASTVQLHVADGSQIVSRDVEGPRLTVGVGRAGRERYGSCHVRLQTPRLDGGYLPVLETSYAAADGVRYRQESFATVIPETGSLVSFVRVVVNPRLAHRKSGIGYLRLTPSVGGCARSATSFGAATARASSSATGARFNGTSLVYATQPRKPLTVYARLARPGPPDEAVRARPCELRAGEALDDPLLEPPALPGRDVRRAREARPRRRAEPADPEHAHVGAVQPRQRVRRLVVRADRRRRGDGRLRLREDRARDPGEVVPEAQPVPEARGRRADGRHGALLPALRGQGVRGPGHARARQVRGELREPAEREQGRDPRPGALRGRRQHAGLRPPRPGAGAAGAPRDVRGLGADRPPVPRGEGRPRGHEARGRDRQGGRRLEGHAAGRLAVRPDRAARRLRAPVRRPDRLAARELLEPRDAVRARVGDVPSGRAGGDGRARLHAQARLTLSGARPLPRLHEPRRTPATARPARTTCTA